MMLVSCVMFNYVLYLFLVVVRVHVISITLICH